MKLLSSTIPADVKFSEASELFLGSLEAPNPASRVQFLRPRTLVSLREHARRTSIFFGDLPLNRIEGAHLLGYQRARALGEGFTRKFGKRVMQSPAGAAKINKEIAFVRNVLERAGLWRGTLPQCYRRLQQVDSEFDAALSYDQQQELLRAAASNPKWHPVWHYAIVALHTTFSADEMRTLRQGDINLAYGIIGVNRRFGKNTFRRREIPITDGACIWALERLLERAAELCGSNSPHHYLFPSRVARGHWSAEQPMSVTGMRPLFREVREAAGVPWFRWNGFRHTAITRLAEVGTPMSVIMRRAGHVSPKMTEHYTHISEQFERMEMERRQDMRPMQLVGQKKPVQSAGVERRQQYA